MTEKITVKQLENFLKEKNLLEFNRSISKKHVEKMQKSVLNCGLLRLPVLGDVSKFDSRGIVIVDGQHLCKAIALLSSKDRPKEIDVILKTYNNKSEVINDISKLNNTQKSWNDENYLDAWYKYGKENIKHWSNYSYLYSKYNDVFDGLSCGYLVDVYSLSKSGFREGTLEFRNVEFSDKLAQLSYKLKKEYNKGSFALQGLRLWAFNRLNSKKTIDWEKLDSRLSWALKNNEDLRIQGREDFYEFVSNTYSRV